MGASSSKNSESSHGGERQPEGGSQLYVSLRMEENLKMKSDLIPHVYGSSPIIGSWDASRSLPMEKDSPSMWELSFVVPANHETLDFKFLLKPTYSNAPCLVEEGPNRLLTRGNLEGDARTAIFQRDGDEEIVVDYRVFIKADIVSPVDLAASWRAYRANMQPSTVRGIPDVSKNAGLDGGNEVLFESVALSVTTRGASGCGLSADIRIRIHLQPGYGYHFFTSVNIRVRIRI